MAYAKPFITTTYDAGGGYVSESEHVSVFEADTSAQRASDGQRVALVKDRRQRHTRIVRVWVDGRTVYCTSHRHKPR